jgi:hypothetical protein
MSFNDEPENDELDSLELDFIPAEVKIVSNLVAKGKYLADIETIKRKINDDGDIVNYCPTVVIAEGPYEGRKLYGRHCGKTTRDGDKAQSMLAMGQKALKQLAIACGVSDANLGPCIGQRVVVSVGIRKGSNGYEDSNQIDGYEPANGAAAPKAAPSTTSKAAAPAASKPSFMARKA